MTATALILMSSPAFAEEPALPMGLGGPAPSASSSSSSEPSLPSGLDDMGSASSGEPALPGGLEEVSTAAEDSAEDEWSAEDDFGDDSDLPFDLSGFFELRGGHRIHEDKHEKDVSLGEARLQLQADAAFSGISARLTTDLLYDPVGDQHSFDPERGEGQLDVREAFFMARPFDFMDVKAGRQILTWGTGDLLFINDMFPKDWVAFFIGRDVEYLKAPSDALKVSLFSDVANLDVVYTPQFDADRYIDGRRISFFNEGLGRLSGEDMPVAVDPRSSAFRDDELALRLYRNFESFEAALYAYSGFWKSPAGQDAMGRAIFPALSVWGASLRGPIYKGIANIETGYYKSRDDDLGTNPAIRNSEVRFLAGYEQELVPELTGGIQYYLEHMSDYDKYRANLPAGAVQKDKNRHMVTLRLTKLMMNQNLQLSLFNFWSPSDDDGFLRPRIDYKINDNWSVQAGGNIFYGDRRNTFWGQFEDNSNIYAGVRFSF
ncbi:MAG: hypothetical protein H6869_10030 [Rhodospirillales bacterium]|nr:hypothetical protein [Rhodospirillales bacterium]